LGLLERLIDPTAKPSQNPIAAAIIGSLGSAEQRAARSPAVRAMKLSGVVAAGAATGKITSAAASAALGMLRDSIPLAFSVLV
jgi:hypothetical protein